jgi:hypothetical protein
MDSSQIVFLPVMNAGKVTDWKLMVVDQSKLNESITERYKWGVRTEFYHFYSRSANMYRIYMADAYSF